MGFCGGFWLTANQSIQLKYNIEVDSHVKLKLARCLVKKTVRILSNINYSYLKKIQMY